MFPTISPGKNLIWLNCISRKQYFKCFFPNVIILVPFQCQEKNEATLHITVIQQSHTVVPYQLMGKYSLYLMIYFLLPFILSIYFKTTSDFAIWGCATDSTPMKKGSDIEKFQNLYLLSTKDKIISHFLQWLFPWRLSHPIHLVLRD